MPVTTRSAGPATHGPYTTPPSTLSDRCRPSPPITVATAPRRPAKPHHSRAGQDNSFGVFWGGDWLETNEEQWGEVIGEEEGMKKKRRAKRMEKKRKQCLGRKKKQRAFLGGRKGKVVEGGRKRDPNGSGKFWKPPPPKRTI